MIDEFRRMLVSQLHATYNVESCNPQTPLSQAVVLMKSRNIGCLIITEDHKVVGIFTERDYLNKIAGHEAEHIQKPIGEFMTPNPKSVRTTDTLFKVMRYMRVGRFRHVVIVNEENHLEGVISVKDVMSFLIDEQT